MNRVHKAAQGREHPPREARESSQHRSGRGAGTWVQLGYTGSLKRYGQVLTLISVNGTLFGNRVFEDIIKLGILR